MGDLLTTEKDCLSIESIDLDNCSINIKYKNQ